MSTEEKKPVSAPTPSAGPQTLLTVGVIVILGALAFIVFLIATGRGAAPAPANNVAATDAPNETAPAPAPASSAMPNRGRLLPSGLRVETVREGTGQPVRPTDTALLRYELRAVGSDEVIDGGMDRPPVPMSPSGGLIQGFAEALTQMREGGEAVFWVPPQLGYGDQGPDPRIGPTTILQFRVRIERILPAGAQSPGAGAARPDNSSNMANDATEAPAH